MILDRIKKPNDIKNIKPEEYEALAGEIREFLIEKISRTGGHLASNLGVVELTMALHLSLNLPEDKIIWDVGHQSYVHKLLTGRREGFDTLRKYGGMSGFPKNRESECDCFDTGHSSTSISAGLGIAMARDLQNQDFTVVSVLGDGSLTGGMSYEALNNAAQMKKNFIIILNDNNMSIAENVGGISSYLDSIRTGRGYLGLKEGVLNMLSSIPHGDMLVSGIRRAKSSVKHLVLPGMFFEDMGITYLGPVDGHNIEAVCKAIGEAKRVGSAVLIHVITDKGKGYSPAERHPSRFHGADAFDIDTGLPKKRREKSNYCDVFGTIMLKLAARDDKICAITAAMPDGTGLKRFHNKFPERFFDVGIAEEHAVTFAAGLARGGMKPVVALYSSFLQRAYDQTIHDVCIQNLPVVFAIDRAGIVGSDGETHQGIFDMSFLSTIPNMHIMAPKNKWELSDMMKYAVALERPVAVRYPRGVAYDGLADFRAPIELGKSEILYEEEDIAILAVGNMVRVCEKVRHALKDIGYSCTLVNARFVKPVDEAVIETLSADHRLIVTVEENIACGGYGEHVRAYFDQLDTSARLMNIALPDDYVEHGNVDILYKEVGLDADSIVRRIITAYAPLGSY